MEKKTERKIIIAAGGTGGHLFPAQALALDVMKEGKITNIIFMSPGLSTNPYFQKEQFPFFEVASASPFRKNPIACLRSLLSLVKGFLQSRRFMKKERPSLVVGFGSFHSFPSLLAAKLLGIPIILFESNIHPGKANRFCSRWATVSAVHFSHAAQFLKGKSRCVQMPLLRKNAGVKAGVARSYFGLKEDLFTFLIFGGSQGAQAINRFFCESLERLKKQGLDFQVIHLAGNPERVEKLASIYESHGIAASVRFFEKQMDYAWAAADLAISRSGAATIAEQIEFGIPAILIPYPYGTEDHQGSNAQFMSKDVGGGVLLREATLGNGLLAKTIEELLCDDQKKLMEMKNSLFAFKEQEEKEEKEELSSLIMENLG